MGEFLAEEGRRLFENGGVFGRGRADVLENFEQKNLVDFWVGGRAKLIKLGSICSQTCLADVD